MEINICPNWLLSRFPLPEDKRLDAALLLSNLLVLAAIPILRFIPHLCLARRVLGMPCPGCGVVHAVTAVFRFDLTSAWHSNPAGIAVAAMLVFQITARTLSVLGSNPVPGVAVFSRHCSAAVVASLLFVWAFRIISGGLNGSY